MGRTRGAGQAASALVGAVFLVVGVLGFIPGITTPYDGMAAAGHESRAELLGIFQVSILHNVVHLLFGVVRLNTADDWLHSCWVPPWSRSASSSGAARGATSRADRTTAGTR